jgi:heme A synthase
MKDLIVLLERMLTAKWTPTVVLIVVIIFRIIIDRADRDSVTMSIGMIGGVLLQCFVGWIWKFSTR